MQTIIALTPEQTDKLNTIKKLLALSRNNDNEHQAAAASAKAMQLAEDYNLDILSIGEDKTGAHTAVHSPRERKQMAGGLYAWQRDLWEGVSELHFCMYWSIKGLKKGDKYEHKILGSVVNVLSAELMAKYLQEVVEREAQKWAKNSGYKSVFVREAVAYREGMAKRLTERLKEARRERIAEDERKAREARTAASHPGAAPGTALVLADVITNEHELNEDAYYGYELGTTTRNRLEREARQAARAEERRQLEAERDAAELADPALKEARLKAEQAHILMKNDRPVAVYQSKSKADTRCNWHKAVMKNTRGAWAHWHVISVEQRS